MNPKIKKHISWFGWLAVTIAIGGYFTFSLVTDSNKRVFLPGKTSHGHYQIETQCGLCHTPFMGVKQEACLDCHAEELEIANDTHPESKFTDPRNADRVAVLDARKCITCHVEHKPERTHPMGLTLPIDYCYRCHSDVAEERPSHQGLAFDACASAGCHNFHDNRALYEDFLAKHLNEPDILDAPVVPQRNMAEIGRRRDENRIGPLTITDHDTPATVEFSSAILLEWESTAHAQAGVNCKGCHQQGNEWENQLNHEACQSCHEDEVKGFLAGRHGMRLAQGLSPMKPESARLPMKTDAHSKELICVTCHSAHRFDTQAATVDACLSCHNDTHSLAYKESPHFALWDAETHGDGEAGSGVSCATCHLPRTAHKRDNVDRIVVQHNQNDNLRPNEKMIREVCMRCHGLGFSIDALADTTLIENNFIGQPSAHVESIEMARRRLDTE